MKWLGNYQPEFHRNVCKILMNVFIRNTKTCFVDGVQIQGQNIKNEVLFKNTCENIFETFGCVIS